MITTRKPEHDMGLFKCGRSTEFTAGRYAGLQTTLLHSWKATSQGLVHTVSREHSVVSLSSKEPFGTRGDSGAAVINAAGHFIGVYFGSNTATATSYFTSAEDLFADILTITGAKDVRLYGCSETLEST